VFLRASSSESIIGLGLINDVKHLFSAIFFINRLAYLSKQDLCEYIDIGWHFPQISFSPNFGRDAANIQKRG
jgi:hypothetical protein